MTEMQNGIPMSVRLAAGAAMLALSVSASAAPISSVFSDLVLAQPPVWPVADCIRYSDCRYRWLRCGKGWCRGPWDPFGSGSIPKVEMRCPTTTEPCAPEQSGWVGTDFWGPLRAVMPQGALE